MTSWRNVLIIALSIITFSSGLVNQYSRIATHKNLEMDMLKKQKGEDIQNLEKANRTTLDLLDIKDRNIKDMEILIDDLKKQYSDKEEQLNNVEKDNEELKKQAVNYRKILSRATKEPPILKERFPENNEFRNRDNFTVTAYAPYDNVSGIENDGNPNITSIGKKPRKGTFAIDPRVIPYGTKIKIVYSDGAVEEGVAEDCGGAIKGNRIDVFRHTYKETTQFGKRSATVYW